MFNRTVHRNDLQHSNCCELKSDQLSSYPVQESDRHFCVPLFFFFILFKKKILHNFVHDIRKPTVSICPTKVIAATRSNDKSVKNGKGHHIYFTTTLTFEIISMVRADKLRLLDNSEYAKQLLILIAWPLGISFINGKRSSGT